MLCVQEQVDVINPLNVGSLTILKANINYDYYEHTLRTYILNAMRIVI